MGKGTPLEISVKMRQWHSSARGLAHLGIRANAVCPGEINAVILSPGTESIVERIPLKRLGEAADIAHMTAFLCAEEAGYITGQVFTVDGGMVM